MSLIMPESDIPEFDFDPERIAKDTIDAVLTEVAFESPFQVSLSFLDEDGIRELNKDYRGIDSATDVLSFPQIEFDIERPYDEQINENSGFDSDPDTGEIVLGDIVLCTEKIRAQAKEYGHSEKREYAFLICHSMLHLLGYDHIENNDRVIMEEKQKIIMEKLSILR